MKNIKSRIKKGAQEVKREVRQKILGYMLAAFGLVAALAWNEAIKGSIEYFFPLSRNTALAKILYAVVLTLVVAIISFYLVKLFGEKKEGK